MRQAPLVPEVIVGEACPVECAVGTGGQANGEHGHWRASPHLQGQTGMQALVGRLGSTLAKGEGHDTEAGRLVPGLFMLLWNSQRPDHGMGSKQAISTTLLYRPS